LAVAELRASLGVGGDAGWIVISRAGYDSRAEDFEKAFDSSGDFGHEGNFDFLIINLDSRLRGNDTRDK